MSPGHVGGRAHTRHVVHHGGAGQNLMERHAEAACGVSGTLRGAADVVRPTCKWPSLRQRRSDRVDRCFRLRICVHARAIRAC